MLFCCPFLQASTPWEALLLQALERGVDAIIDCGAMLAGVDLRWGAVGMCCCADSKPFQPHVIAGLLRRCAELACVSTAYRPLVAL